MKRRVGVQKNLDDAMRSVLEEDADSKLGVGVEVALHAPVIAVNAHSIITGVFRLHPRRREEVREDVLRRGTEMNAPRAVLYTNTNHNQCLLRRWEWRRKQERRALRWRNPHLDSDDAFVFWMLSFNHR